MTTFKPGDRVRLNQDYSSLPRGAEGTVVSASTIAGSTLLNVKFDARRFPISAWAHRLELIQEETMEYIAQKLMSTIEQAQMFLGKKVLVKSKQGSALMIGKVVEVRQGIRSDNTPGVTMVAVEPVFSRNNPHSFRFKDQTFEEIQ